MSLVWSRALRLITSRPCAKCSPQACPGFEQLGPTEDRGRRRAQFVRNHSEELIPLLFFHLRLGFNHYDSKCSSANTMSYYPKGARERHSSMAARGTLSRLEAAASLGCVWKRNDTYPTKGKLFPLFVSHRQYA